MRGQGQSLQSLQSLRGEGQQPLQPLRGQGQSLQSLRGEGKQPVQPMRGQGQQPVQPMRGQGQQPMQSVQSLRKEKIGESLRPVGPSSRSHLPSLDLPNKNDWPDTGFAPMAEDG